MNIISATQNGLQNMIEQLQKQKEELTNVYQAAISNGEKYINVKTMYLNLRDVDKRLNDLMRVGF